MLKSLLQNKKFNKIIGDFFKKNKEIIDDLVIFGSIMKGKSKPKDIDLLIVYKNKEDSDETYALRKKLEELYNIDLYSRTTKTLTDPGFIPREAYLLEGYSLIDKKHVAEKYGLEAVFLFKYNIKSFNDTQRMKFYYALNGRTMKGILHSIGAKRYSSELIIVHLENAETMREFLNFHNVSWDELPILLPKRLLKPIFE